MNYYELTFTYTSPVETSIINDVLAAELGEIGFESFAENENGLQGYISDQLYNVKGLQDKLAEFPLENVDIHFTETLVESKDWNEEWEKNYFKQRTTRHGLRNSRTGHPCPYERSRTRGGHRH